MSKRSLIYPRMTARDIIDAARAAGNSSAMARNPAPCDMYRWEPEDYKAAAAVSIALRDRYRHECDECNAECGCGLSADDVEAESGGVPAESLRRWQHLCDECLARATSYDPMGREVWEAR